jgi:thiol-disulfide isomerase/thioredoxin
VVLLDIWTYSCINCQRTIPYINNWYSKYKDQGLEVVGLHTPEFGFEKVQANVEKAVKGFDIKYPVVLDNDYSTWMALGNNYWPRKYLIDTDGYIIYDHIGEGGYEEMERAIQMALEQRNARLGINSSISKDTTEPNNVISSEVDKVGSPEVYFGSSRNQYFANGTQNTKGGQTLSLPQSILPNRLYLGGTWNITPEYAETTGSADVVFNYTSKNVYMAAGSDKGVDIEIYKDDLFLKKIHIGDEKLYTLIGDTDYGTHTLRIKILQKGLKAFTFTFG